MRYLLAAGAAMIASASIAFAAPAVDTATAEAVIRGCVSIYHEPIDGKSHPCGCPFDHMRMVTSAAGSARTIDRAVPSPSVL